MLQACLNGGIFKTVNSAVPVSASELAEDARAVWLAGAQELHIHPRSANGAETLTPTDVAEALLSIRKTVPGMPIGVGTGAWINPGARLPHAHIACWTEKPDYASVNLGEEDAIEVIEILKSIDVKIEAGIWNCDDAKKFVRQVKFEKCLRVLIEMPDTSSEKALTKATKVLRVLADAKCRLPVLLHGEGHSVWPCLQEACRRGFAARVGFEDGAHLPNGRLARNNSELVKAAVKIIKS